MYLFNSCSPKVWVIFRNFQYRRDVYAFIFLAKQKGEN